MEINRLLPNRTAISVAEAVEEFLESATVPANRPLVYLNMVSSIDGHTTVDGRSRALGGPADTELLLELRASADAILVGTSTVRIEGYGRMVRAEQRRARRVARGLPADPLAVLVSRRFEIPWEAGLFAAPDQSVVIFTSEEAGEPPAVAANVNVVRLPNCSPTHVLRRLRSEFGVEKLLCEGGPTLNGVLLRENLVDELFLTLSPLIVGNDSENVLVRGAQLEMPQDVELVWLHEHESELFLRYRVKRSSR